MLRLRPYEINALQDVVDRIENGEEFCISSGLSGEDFEPLMTQLIACCISECIYQNVVANDEEED